MPCECLSASHAAAGWKARAPVVSALALNTPGHTRLNSSAQRARFPSPDQHSFDFMPGRQSQAGGSWAGESKRTSFRKIEMPLPWKQRATPQQKHFQHFSISAFNFCFCVAYFGVPVSHLKARNALGMFRFHPATKKFSSFTPQLPLHTSDDREDRPPLTENKNS